MKIAIVSDEEKNITPLDQGSEIMIFDDSTGKAERYENPGFANPRGGKEIAMSIILKLKPDAILVKEGSLCPGSYGMSLGKLKYIPVESDNVDENLKNVPELKKRAEDSLSEDFFRE